MRAIGLSGSIQENVLRLYGEGREPWQIAQALGIGLAATLFHLNNLPLNYRPASKPARVGWSRIRSERLLGAAEERREQIAELWNDGRSTEGIAMELNMTEGAVRRALQRMRRSGRYQLAGAFHALAKIANHRGDGVVSHRAEHAVLGVAAREVRRSSARSPLAFVAAQGSDGGRHG